MNKNNFAPNLQANVVNGKPILLTGSSHMIGNLNIKFDELVSLFGKPQECEDDKVDAIWEIEFEDQYDLATGEKNSMLPPMKVRIDIHNWKDGPNYGGYDVKDIVSWNIGGNYVRDVFVLIRYLEDKGVEFSATIPVFMIEQAKRVEGFKGSPNRFVKFI
tara:strand:+ start:52 stop:531 length:480 start_codon:yes stop_codon:yes gene_type:complete